jgi:hypothetical protein
MHFPWKENGMRFLAALPLALLPLASAASAPPTGAIPRGGEILLTPPAHCDPVTNVVRTDAPGTVTARRLDQLPPGRLDLAVMRQVDRCPQPVTVREGYGAFGSREASKPAVAPAVPPVRLLGN